MHSADKPYDTNGCFTMAAAQHAQRVSLHQRLGWPLLHLHLHHDYDHHHRTCSETGGAGVLNAAGVFPPTGAGGPMSPPTDAKPAAACPCPCAAALPPVLTGSSSLIVSDGLSEPAAAWPV
jgi:hypothetical protein